MREAGTLHANRRSPGMDDSDDHIERTTVEARQGNMLHSMRYVLGFGLVGAILGLLAVWLIVNQ